MEGNIVNQDNAGDSGRYLIDWKSDMPMPRISVYGRKGDAPAGRGQGDATTLRENGADANPADLPSLIAGVTATASGLLALNTVTEVSVPGGNPTMTLPGAVDDSLIVCELSGATSTVAITGSIRGVESSTITLQLGSESVMLLGYGDTWWPIADHKTLQSLDTRYVPQTQMQPTSGGIASSFTSFAVQPTGTTDTLGPFSDIFSVQVYGTAPAVRETVGMSGYNIPPEYGGANHNSAQGSVYTAIHPDAGDTNISGAHGMEWLIGMAGPGRAWSINPILVLAVNDSSESVNITFTCGTGRDSGRIGGFNFNDSAGNLWFTLGPKASLPNAAGPGVISRYPFAVFPASGTGAAATMYLASPDQGVNFTLNAFAGKNAQILYQLSSSTKWINQCTSKGFYTLEDVSSSSYPMYLQQVASDVPLFRTQSTFRVETGSLIVGSAAIATTAKRGFFYAPSCAGPPTGTPVTQTGTVPMVVDSTDSKVYFYVSGGWKSVTVA